MRARIPSLLLIATLAVVPASAQDDKPRTPLPVNAFKKAREGDWAVLTGTVTEKDKARDHSLRFRVQSGGGEDVTTIVELGPFRGDPKPFLFGFGAKEGPTLEQTFAWARAGTIGDVTVVDEEKKLGDRAFACKKLSFTGTLGDRKTTVVAWMATEVRGCGLVAVTVTGPERSLAFELAGFGAEAKVEWGKSWDDLRAEWEKAHKDDPPESSEK